MLCQEIIIWWMCISILFELILLIQAGTCTKNLCITTLYRLRFYGWACVYCIWRVWIFEIWNFEFYANESGEYISPNRNIFKFLWISAKTFRGHLSLHQVSNKKKSCVKFTDRNTVVWTEFFRHKTKTHPVQWLYEIY